MKGHGPFKSNSFIFFIAINEILLITKTRLDTRLTQSRAGRQEPYSRSPDHLGRSSEAKGRKNPKKVKCDGGTDKQINGQTDGLTDRQSEVKSSVARN